MRRLGEAKLRVIVRNGDDSCTGQYERIKLIKENICNDLILPSSELLLFFRLISDDYKVLIFISSFFYSFK